MAFLRSKFDLHLGRRDTFRPARSSGREFGLCAGGVKDYPTNQLFIYIYIIYGEIERDHTTPL